MKNTPEEPLPSLAELEAEAEAYGRRIVREYLQEELRRLAETHGAVFPPSARRLWQRRLQFPGGLDRGLARWPGPGKLNAARAASRAEGSAAQAPGA